MTQGSLDGSGSGGRGGPKLAGGRGGRNPADGRRGPNRTGGRGGPKLARHLVEWIIDEPGAEAIVGDIEEGYAAGRSRLWYWSQALGAILTWARRWSRGGGLAVDFKIAARKMRAFPGFTAVVVLTLALGIGANAAVFSVINQVLLTPLPYPQPDRLVAIETELTLQSGNRAPTSPPELAEIVMGTRSLSAAGGIWYRPAALTDDADEPEEIDMAFVSAELLPALGVDAWVTFGGSYGEYRRTFRIFEMVGRLAPGTTLAGLNAELAAIAESIDSEHADYDGTGFELHASPLDASVVAAARPGLLLLSAAVGAVLLIVCANVANLYLARASEARRDIAVRRALGASRGRLLRALTIDCALITAIGATAGVLLARVAISLLPLMAPEGVPRVDAVRLDLRVVAFAAALADRRRSPRRPRVARP